MSRCARVRRIADALEHPVERMPETALRFILSHPDVSAVIPGMRSIRNVEANCAVSDAGGLPKEQMEKLRAHAWKRNFYRAD